METPSHSRTIAYILGAGFSHGTDHKVVSGSHHLSMPTQVNLFREICRHRHRTIGTLDGVAQTIRHYFSPSTYRPKRKFSSGYRRHEDLFGFSIEDIVTFLDEFRLRHAPVDRKITHASEFFRKSVTELMSLLSTKGSPGHNPLLKKFSKRLLTTDIVITLNWDTLLDRALTNTRRWHPKYGYGRSTSEQFFMSDFPNVKKPSKNVRLYKLHGSVNWIASHHGNIDRGNFYIDKDWGGRSQLRSAVMIPPKMIKEEIWSDGQHDALGRQSRVPFSVTGEINGIDAVTTHFFPSLWNEAERSLARAKRIVFIGYSFPPADFAFTNLIRRAIAERKRTFGTPPDIEIVDPNVGNLAERFQSTFKIEVPNENRSLSLKNYLFSHRVS